MTKEEALKVLDTIPTISEQVDALEMAIKALEQQPCEDCISREATLKAFAEKCGGECGCCEYNGSGYDTAENCKLIKSMPSVTPQPKKGKWINNPDADCGGGFFICSECGTELYDAWKYCPECGSDNREEADE